MAQVAVWAGVGGLALYALRRYLSGGACTSGARLDGKVIIITGANVGLGKETAIDLARRGGRIIMACRSLERATAAASEIRKAAGVPEEMIKVMKLDLASFKSVREFAEKYQKEESRLDILMNNAGVYPPYTITEDGLELTFQANHLGTGVTTYAVHPGVVGTELRRDVPLLNYPGISQLMYITRYPFMKNASEGAQTQIYCAVDESVASQTGLYYADCAVKEPSKGAQIEEDANKLWEISEELCGLKPKHG